MESRRNLRVLPSNAPTLVESESIHRSPLENPSLHMPPRTCPKYNNGIDCRFCSLLHACSTCLQDDHDTRSCKRGILTVSSGNIGSCELTIKTDDHKNSQGVHYASPASHTIVKAPESSTRNAIKLEHRRRKRGLDAYKRLPLFYRCKSTRRLIFPFWGHEVRKHALGAFCSHGMSQDSSCQLRRISLTPKSQYSGALIIQIRCVQGEVSK